MTLRMIGAVAALVSAAVHGWEYFANGYDATRVGVPFLINMVAGAVIAILLLTWRHWIPLFLLFGFGVLTLGGFVTSATIGLLGVHETWTGLPIWAAAIAEAVAIVVALLAAAVERRRARGAVPGRA